ncbi:hypothetical protein MKW92_033396 [Papaver armeniacum]|nr:hypothetical protein MKW92_033396 [Papaver armeniacum]
MEGLKAMGKEANHAASNNAGTSMPTIMNPNDSLGETSSAPQRPTSAGRFGYCRDPIVPLSGNKRLKATRPNNFYPVPPPPPSYQPHRAFEPNPHQSPNSWRSPVAPHRAFEPNPWRSPVAPNRAFEPNPHHSLNSWRSPVAPPFYGNRGPPPQAWNRPGGTGGYYHPSNSSVGVYRGSVSGRVVGSHPGLKNPYPRRGSNYTFSNSPRPGAGRGRGRGRGSHVCTSARERPEMLYNKSMIQDPWKLLKPVVRNSVGFEDGLPESITKKRPRTSETTSNSCSPIKPC